MYCVNKYISRQKYLVSNGYQGSTFTANSNFTKFGFDSAWVTIHAKIDRSNTEKANNVIFAAKAVIFTWMHDQMVKKQTRKFRSLPVSVLLTEVLNIMYVLGKHYKENVNSQVVSFVGFQSARTCR